MFYFLVMVFSFNLSFKVAVTWHLLISIYLDYPSSWYFVKHGFTCFPPKSPHFEEIFPYPSTNFHPKSIFMNNFWTKTQPRPTKITPKKLQGLYQNSKFYQKMRRIKTGFYITNTRVKGDDPFLYFFFRKFETELHFFKFELFSNLISWTLLKDKSDVTKAKK